MLGAQTNIKEVFDFEALKSYHHCKNLRKCVDEGNGDQVCLMHVIDGCDYKCNCGSIDKLIDCKQYDGPLKADLDGLRRA